MLEVSKKSEASSGSSKNDTPEMKSLSFEEISARYKQYVDKLDQPSHLEALKKILDIPNGIELEQCICLGLGRFAIDPAAVGPRQQSLADGSMRQLAALKIFLRILSDKYRIQEVCIQDPVFLPIEETFLESLGYTVLKRPEACKKMSTKTFLYAPYLPSFITSEALDVAHPALYIGNNPISQLESLESPPTEEDRKKIPAHMLARHPVWAASYRKFLEDIDKRGASLDFHEQYSEIAQRRLYLLPPAVAESRVAGVLRRIGAILKSVWARIKRSMLRNIRRSPAD